jgi:citrate lyase subunit beta/citryl-CoA lyase
MMRSLLFVPGDDSRKLGKALGSGADALILDLEDSVAEDAKSMARRTCLEFLKSALPIAGRPALYVRINALDSGLSDGDLDAVMTAGPDGIVLPKAQSGSDVSLLDARIAVREALHDFAEGRTGIIAIATETAASVFGLGTYGEASPRLGGLTWGGEDLAADIGAGANKDADGHWTQPFVLARNLCLFGAVSAGVQPIDTVYTDFRDTDGLRREALSAANDGFTGKLAIHPAQVPVINELFTPSSEAVAHARRIVEAFSAAGNAGVVGLDGKMIDRPHLIAAHRILERAGLKSDLKS